MRACGWPYGVCLKSPARLALVIKHLDSTQAIIPSN